AKGFPIIVPIWLYRPRCRVCRGTGIPSLFWSSPTTVGHAMARHGASHTGGTPVPRGMGILPMDIPCPEESRNSRDAPWRVRPLTRHAASLLHVGSASRRRQVPHRLGDVSCANTGGVHQLFGSA